MLRNWEEGVVVDKKARSKYWVEDSPFPIIPYAHTPIFRLREGLELARLKKVY